MRRLASSAPLLALTGLCAAAASLVPDTASAAECGTFVADEGDNLIFYGQLATTFPMGSTCVGVRPAFTPTGLIQAVVCWRDQHGDWHLEDVLGCNSSTPVGDDMLILGAGGDDVVMPVIHRGLNDEFVCPVAGTSGTLHWAGSTPPSFPVSEWYGRSDLYTERAGGTGCVHDEGCSYFDFGVSIQGGDGEDELHGAPEDDHLLSSDLLGDPWCLPHGGRGSGDSTIDACVCDTDITCCNTEWDWACVQLGLACGAECYSEPSLRADQSMDILCGHGGDDDLIGDEDPNPYDFELLSGGPGAGDFCRGVVQSPTTPCCEISSTPGCSDPTIEAAVCGADPFCCSTYWDGLCVGQVTTVAGRDCSAGTPPCCDPSTTPGCPDDAVIEAAVCAADPYCCSTAWDWICRNQVITVAGESCDPIRDIATTTCETFAEADVSSTGFGATARAVCADDDVESIPAMPPGSSAVITDYRVATDFLAPSCF